jgi:hypothetical protein
MDLTCYQDRLDIMVNRITYEKKLTIDHKLNIISELNVIPAIQWKSKIALAST